VKVEPLISHRLPLEGLLTGLELMDKHDPGVKKVMILPNG
jgi:threonine dehydrogenase-like Zn-dependent dehydrogenase